MQLETRWFGQAGSASGKRVKIRLSVSALALFLACASPEVGEEAAPSPEKAPAAKAEAGAAAPAPPPAEAEAVAAEPDPVPAEPASRRLTEDARAQMIEILSRESDGERRIWIAVTAGQAEPIALRSQFRAMFEEAGIGVEEVDLRGLRLKPGLRVLIAEESFPLWVSTFLEAFDASGLEIPSASGYRPYYRDMIEKNPNWPGLPMSDEADILLVVGPEAQAE